jgi:hypothetical protein
MCGCAREKLRCSRIRF